jgi:eukaryotic-like serine/threonine-protein kinase
MRERTPIHFRGTERFELLSLLGRGASGVVYEARDRERGGLVALKVLGERSPLAIAHFKHEFRALQELRHPNLVELKELICEGGHWLLAMQLVRGVDIASYTWGETPSSLADTASQPLAASAEDDTIRACHVMGSGSGMQGTQPRVLSEARLRAAFGQLARGLAALHAAGKLHRDVKRSNVLVDADGRVTILDFGLVAELDPFGSVAQDAFAGTPATMSPEQAALGRVGPASDWYGFGAVLYHALTGRSPFVGSSAEILEQKRQKVPLAPAALVKTVPRDLSELALELLAIDPERRPGAEAVDARLRGTRACAGPEQARRPATRADSLFVGRASEMQVLEDGLARTRRGHAVTVVLEGESGVGKTALVREFLAGVRRRGEPLAVFAGRCFERESLPYKALDGVVDALCEHLSRLQRAAVAELLPPDAAELARAFPVLHRVFEAPVSGAERTSVDPHARRMRMFGALRELFARIAAERTSAIVLDDMQWADVDSMAMLAALLEEPGPPLFWVVIRRTATLATRLPLPCETSTLSLGPLSSLESDALVGELLGAQDAPLPVALTDRIGEAHGHPLFLREIARHIAATPEQALPPGLDDALWLRACTLAPTARRLLQLIAVAGRPLAQGVVATALLFGEEKVASVDTLANSAPGLADVLDHVAALRHECFVCTTGTHPNDTIETYHDRVREAVLTRLDGGATRQSHHLLARALERAGGGDAEALAHHWRGAGIHDRAHDYAVKAAEEAAAALAFERAARLYRNAIELAAPNAERLSELEQKLGDALANGGRGVEAAEVYRSAASRTEGIVSVGLERAAAEQLLRSGHVEQGLRAVSGVLHRLGFATPRTRFTAVLSLALLRLRLWARTFRFRPRAEAEVPALELARLDGAWMAATCLTMFDGLQSAELQCRTTLRALDTGTRLHVLRAHTAEGMFLALAGQALRPRIERAFVAASALATALGDAIADGWVAVSRGASAFFLGDWAESEAQCTAAEAIFADRPGTSFELASARAFLVWSAMMRGRFATVLERVPDYVAEAEKRGDLYAATYQMTGFSNVAWLSYDDVAEARRMLALAESRWPSKHFDVPRYMNMIAGAHIELYAGRGGPALERIRRDWRALRWGVAFRAQITRFGMRFVRGLAALAAHDECGDRALLRDARACERAIAAERVTWSECFAAILAFGVHARRGDPERALGALVAAEAKAAATGMLLHRAVVRHRRGELVGGDEGRALRDDCLAFMHAQNIKNPTRMLDMLSPRLGRGYSGERSDRS